MERTEHRKKWETCQCCPDMCGNVPAIISLSPPRETNLRVLFLGEAPGRSEVDLKRPFIGPSGTLLRDIIREVQQEVVFRPYLQNTICCRPPDNRDPNKLEILNCRTRLLECLLIVNPTFIVTVGNIAKQVLADLKKLSEKKLLLSGLSEKSTRRVSRIIKRPTCHMLHPASILRAPNTKQFFIRETTRVDLAANLKTLIKDTFND